MYQRFLAACLLAAACGQLSAAVDVNAADEAALRSFFEGKSVIVKLDMPGTSAGVDVYPDAARPMDTAAYALRLKANGIAIHNGQSVTVTKLHVKDKLIEFQLDGGGFGTMGDDTSTVVVAPYVGKSSRERDVEQRLKSEKDPERRKRLQRELNDLRDERERENQRNRTAATAAEEQKKQRVAFQRLQGGSRFNVRYNEGVPPGLGPDGVMRALAEYVEFPFANPAGGSAVRTGPRPPAAGAIRKGMSMTEVEDVLGRPDKTTSRLEGTLNVVTAIYSHEDEHVTADFVEGVLVRYSIASR